ncbi:prepilin peptidase [Ferrovibrio sp.]|uniref:prepilin peptidase n=1 Tax=Ferrovibrio sp. TaxID=1917215 RepID=UPI0025C2489A|nr:prepilin peptidase [Ferrovibrio sp.]MBX3456023.1 prepilin peptidase [Ferrovibrio sp.]
MTIALLPAPLPVAMPLLVAVPLLGAVMGSFLATAALRGAYGESLLHPPSHCRGCGRRLNAIDLLPILGYALRRGRCTDCGTPIPALFPLAETAGLLIGLSALWQFAGADLLAALLFGLLLLAIALRDSRDFTIPDILSYGLILSGLGATAWLKPALLPEHALAALLGGGLLALLAWGYKRLRGRDGMGWGDVKLLAGIGAWMGLHSLPMVVLLAALGGIAQAVWQSRGKPQATMMIPLGSWLGIAAWLLYVGQP